MRTLTLLALITILTACGGGKDKNADSAPPAQHAQKVVISESEAGERTWYLSANTAEFYTEKNAYAVLENPYLAFQKNGVEQSNIKSREGHYDFNTHLVIMSGNVVGNSLTENVQIKTQKAFYDTETKEVWINTKVTIIRAGVTVNGAGLKSNADFSEIEIFRQKTILPKNIEDFELSSTNLI